MSVPATIGSGEAYALTAELSRVGDPLKLYAKLSDNGRRRDTMLYEGTLGESLILDAAALRIECRAGVVTAEALSAGGRVALAALAERLSAQLLDRGDSSARFGFTRCESADEEVRLAAPSPLDVVRELGLKFANLSGHEPLALSLPGVLAYDHVEMFEALPEPHADLLEFPDFIFWLPESIVVVRPGGEARLICTAYGSDQSSAAHTVLGQAHRRLEELKARIRGRGPAFPEAYAANDQEPAVDLSDEQYCALVERAKGHVKAGDVFQIVPSRTFSLPCAEPIAAFARLRETDPSPYMFYVAGPRHTLFGCSPETAVRVFAGAEGKLGVEIKPIAGTRPRGHDTDEDNRLELDLRLDEKETAEHMMLVDLARNDVARISRGGTRQVSKLLTTERYARVMHLVSAVDGELEEGRDAFTAIQTCLNVGTLCGAPKLRAQQLLREMEHTKRGPYGGAVGWLSSNGELNSGVIIRSAVVVDGVAHVRAGAGVVADSVPLSEADETRRKAGAVLSAIAAAGGGAR
jgi:anthranilate synthase component I